MQILCTLRESGHSVTFISLYPCDDPSYELQLKKLGIGVYSGDAPRLRFHGRDILSRWSFDTICREQQFDLAILTMWFWHTLSVPEHYMHDIWSLSPRTRIAVLTDDRHGARQRQLAELKKSVVAAECASDLECRERDVYRRADLVLTISELEKKAISTMATRVPIFIIPFVANSQPAVRSYDQRANVLFLANFGNEAATDAMRWFSRAIWPSILRRLPEVEITFAGPFSEDKGQSSVPNCRCFGYVSDLRSLFEQHRLFVSPVRFGTGLSTKNVTAMANGLPVVTTKIGAQSLGSRSGHNIIVQNTASGFADAVVKVYTDAALWHQLSQASATHVGTAFPQSALRIALHRALAYATCNTPTDRLVSTPWSSRVIDSIRGLCPCASPDKSRIARFMAYLSLGSIYLESGKAALALSQLRHACSLFQGEWRTTALHGKLLWELERSYLAIGNPESARRCVVEQKRGSRLAPPQL
jgi:glycosyltransferase involved in cell wall biosynthesis